MKFAVSEALLSARVAKLQQLVRDAAVTRLTDDDLYDEWGVPH